MRPFLIDSHCHLDRFEEIDIVLERAQEAGVGCIVSICVDCENFNAVLPIAQKYPWVFASVGIHPCHVKDQDAQDVRQWLLRHAGNPRVVGLGETGLDAMDHSPAMEKQIALFKVHIEVALTTGLPLIVHLRDAEDVFLKIMDTYAIKPKGVLHCFTGSLLCAQKAISWGWKVSISGIVTFSNAHSLQETVRALDLKDILIETDAPWLAPHPYRGKRNEPSYLVSTAQKIADLKGLSVEDVARQTSANGREVFGPLCMEPLDS